MGRSWQDFDAGVYADEVLADAVLGRTMLMVRTPEQLAALPRVRQVESLHISDAEGIPESLAGLRLKTLVLFQSGLTELDALTVQEELDYLGLYSCTNLSGLGPLAALPRLTSLVLSNLPFGLDASPLAELQALEWLTINTPPGVALVSHLPAPQSLKGLALRHPGILLDSLERWPDLETLTVSEPAHVSRLKALPPLPHLRSLNVADHGELDLTVLLGQPQVESVHLGNCRCPDGLAALRDLPGLRRLVLTGFCLLYTSRDRPGAAHHRARFEGPGRRPGPDPAGADQEAEPLVIRPGGAERHQTRTEPPRAKAGLVASGGGAARGSAISATSGPCFAARASRKGRSKP